MLDILRQHLRASGGLIWLCDAHGALARVISSGETPKVFAADGAGERLPSLCEYEDQDRSAARRRWAADLERAAGAPVLGAAALAAGAEEIGAVCLFGAPGVQPTGWQQEGLSAAALEIALAISHLRLRQTVEQRLRARTERWSALYEVAVSLAHAMDGDALLDELVRRAIMLLDAGGGSLSVSDAATGETVIQTAYANGAPVPDLIGYRMPAGEGLAARVIESRATLHISDFQFIPYTGAASPWRTSVIAAPLFVQNVAVGALAVGDNPEVRRFTEDDVQTLELLAQAVGAILERIHGRRQQESLTIHNERARLARELHDGLAQNLATLLLKAELCHDLALDTQPALAQQIDQLAEGLQQAVRETRAAIASLHEAPSDRERLVDALKLLAARFEAQTGVPVTLTWEGEAHREFPAAAHMTLLRVAQEALANVRKHACARRVFVHVNAGSPNFVRLSVHDDGCGFDTAELDDRGSQRFGLRGMRGRMEELGGSLDIDTAPGAGTTVSAVLPLRAPGR